MSVWLRKIAGLWRFLIYLLRLLSEHLRCLRGRHGALERYILLPLSLGFVMKQLVNKVVLHYHVLF
jgi:hypothetical protein